MKRLHTLSFVLFLSLLLRTASAQSDGPIFFLDPAGHTSVVHQALFTADGKEVLSVGEDKVIRIWDTKTGRQLGTIHGEVGRGPEDKLYAAALSRDGKVLAVAGNTYEGALSGDFEKNRVYIRLIHLDDLRAQPVRVSMTLLPSSRAVKAHMNTIYALAFSPTDSAVLASGSQDNTVCLWDTGTGRCLHVLEGHGDGVDGLAWSPDGKHLASAGLDSKVCFWNTQDGTLDRSATLDHPARAVAWSPDSRYVAAGDTGGFITLFRDGGRKQAGRWKQAQSVSSLTFSPDSRTLIGGQEGVGPRYPVTTWTVPDGHPDAEFNRHTANVTSLNFSPDGTRFASAGGSDNDIYLRETLGGPLLRLAGSGGATSETAWAQTPGAGGKTDYQLAWKTGGRAVHIFDFMQAMTTAPKTPPAAGALRRSADGRTLSHSALAVTLSTGVSFPPKPDASDINAQNDFILCQSFTPDGRAVVVGSRFTLALYDASSGMLLRKFIGHTGPVTSVAVSPDGKYLASSSSDQTVAVWPLAGSGDAQSPLIQLFAGSDGEYVAWNPEFGYYACSPEGERLIGWQTNNGPDKLADYAPASSFVNRNRPDVMALLLAKGNVIDAIAAAGASAQKIQQTAPTVQITSAAGNTTLSRTAAFRVMVTPRAGNALDRLSVSVNGHTRAVRRFAGDAFDARDFQKQGERWVGTISVKLRPGANTVTALAVGADKNESPVSSVTVTSAASAGGGLPALNVLAVGISKYDRFLDLTYPDADAVSIADAFKAQEGRLFSRVDVMTLTDAQATRAGIRAALAALKNKGQTQDENDYNVVFVAGHGGDVNGDQYYLIPSDVDTSSEASVQRTAVPWSDFDDALQSLPGNVILLLDACHSAGKGGSNNAAYASVLDSLAHRVSNGSSPIITFASCLPSETSQEGPQWRHGVFTRVLLDGLGGRAAAPSGVVTVDSLAQYLRVQVAKQTGSQQNPRAFGVDTSNVTADLPLARPSRAAALPAARREAQR